MKIKTLLLFLFPFILIGQNSFQNILSNEQAFEIAKNFGLRSINHPIKSYYQNPNSEMIKRLNRLKSDYYLTYKIVDFNNLYQINLDADTNEYVTARTSNGNIVTTYLACGLVEPINVTEVRFHPSKINTQRAAVTYKIIDVSKFGLALKDIELNQTFTEYLDLTPTSNGWQPDYESSNNLLLSAFNSSRYGTKGLKNHENSINNHNFLNSLPTIIVGKWNRSTTNPKKEETYIFKKDMTFLNIKGMAENEGQYEFKGIYNSKVFGEQMQVFLNYYNGSKKTIYISQNGETGIYISTGFDGFPFQKE